MIDVSAPIEAVHTDGRVVPLRFDAVEYGYIVTTSSPASDSNEWWHPDGRDACQRSGWTLRNVKEPTMKTAHEHLDRLEALARRIAEASIPLASGLHSFREYRSEARAIVVAIDGPKTDGEWARKLADDWRLDPDRPPVTFLTRTAITKGRELQRNEQANPDFGRE